MPKKRGPNRTFNEKLYDKVDASFNKREADKIASKLRKDGNRAILDEGKQDKKKTYFIYMRKGARDPKK